MELTSQVQALVAVGAAVGANCQPCLLSTIESAHKSGVSQQEIADAIEVGKCVRKGAASKMDKFASELNTPLTATGPVTEGGCECGLLQTQEEQHG